MKYILILYRQQFRFTNFTRRLRQHNKRLRYNDASLWGTNKTVKLQQLGNNNDIGLWTSGGYQTLRGHIDGDWNDLFLDVLTVT